MGLSISFQLCNVALYIFSWLSENGTPGANLGLPTKRNVSMSIRAFEEEEACAAAAAAAARSLFLFRVPEC